MPFWLHVAVKWIHVAGAIAWLGGVLFTVTALSPALRRELEPPQRQRLMNTAMGRYRRILNVLVTVQVLAGLLLAYFRLGGNWAAFWLNLTASRPGLILLLKTVLVLGLLGLYLLGPKIVLQPAPAPGAGPAGMMTSAQLHLSMLILGGLTVMLAVMIG